MNLISQQIIPEELTALLLRRLLDWLDVSLRDAYDALRQQLSLHNGAARFLENTLKLWYIIEPYFIMIELFGFKSRAE